jgi:hypothetical protein
MTDHEHDAAADAIEIVEIDTYDSDLMPLNEWCDLLAGARDLHRRRFDGTSLWSGTTVDGRMFTAVVAGERVLVDFLPWALRTGPTKSAANDDSSFRIR